MLVSRFSHTIRSTAATPGTPQAVRCGQRGPHPAVPLSAPFASPVGVPDSAVRDRLRPRSGGPLAAALLAVAAGVPLALPLSRPSGGDQLARRALVTSHGLLLRPSPLRPPPAAHRRRNGSDRLSCPASPNGAWDVAMNVQAPCGTASPPVGHVRASTTGVAGTVFRARGAAAVPAMGVAVHRDRRRVLLRRRLWQAHRRRRPCTSRSGRPEHLPMARADRLAEPRTPLIGVFGLAFASPRRRDDWISARRDPRVPLPRTHAGARSPYAHSLVAMTPTAVRRLLTATARTSACASGLARIARVARVSCSQPHDSARPSPQSALGAGRNRFRCCMSAGATIRTAPPAASRHRLDRYCAVSPGRPPRRLGNHVSFCAP